MRLNTRGISQHWLCLESPSFLSDSPLGSGGCRQWDNILLCLHLYWWNSGSSMELLFRSSPCKASERVLCSLGDSFWWTLLWMCSALISGVKKRPRTNPSWGDGCNGEMKVPMVMFCTFILHKSPLQQSVRVCLRNVCTRTRKAFGYLRTDSPSSWILVWILFTVTFPLGCLIWQRMYIYINKNLTTLNNWTTDFEYVFHNTHKHTHMSKIARARN